MAQPSEESMQKMQMLEQAAHAHAVQRQSMQAQLHETEHALAELEGSKEAYRLMGNILVKAEPEKLRAELVEKKSTLHARVNSVEKQEAKLREEMEKLKEQLLNR
jgi:prefoldin beta subunit